MPLPPLTEDQGKCLDALLIKGDYTDADEVAELLSEAGMAQSSGRPFTRAAVHKILKDLDRDLIDAPTVGRITADRRIALLGQRGVAANPQLKQLAATALRYDSPRRSRFGFNYRGQYGASAGLALIADDYAAFNQHYRQFQYYHHSGYGSPPPTLVEQLKLVAEPDFWTWRDIGLQYFLLAQLSRHPSALDDRMTATAAAILQRQDFLGIEAYRLPERVGILRLDALLQDEVIRRKHFDLDQLYTLVSGGDTDGALLRERLDTSEGDLDFVDFAFLAAAYRAGTMDADAMAMHLATNHETQTKAAYAAFALWAEDRRGRKVTDADLANAVAEAPAPDRLEAIVLLWVANWLGLQLPAELTDRTIATAAQLLTDRQHPYVLGELLNGLAALLPLHPERSNWQRAAEELAQRHGFHYLLALQPVRPRWESALRQVERLVLADKRKTKAEEGSVQQPALRTVWIVDFDRHDIYPKEQKLGPRGYSKGRKLRWDELFQPAFRQYREPQDLNAVHGLRYYDGRPVRLDSYLNDDYVTIHFERLLYELADHPRLLLGEGKRLPLTVTVGQAGVTVEDRDDMLQLRFEPPVTSPGNYQLRQVTPTRYLVYHLSDRQRELAASIGYGLDVPASARERLEATIEGMRGDVSVQSDTDLLRSDLPVVSGATRLSLHLLPLGEGYQVQLLVRPVTDPPLYYPPGEGMRRNLVAGEDGRRILERDLEAETEAARALVSDCPSLGAPIAGSNEWELTDEHATLAFLLELQELVQADRVEVEYPRGEPLRLTSLADFDSLKLRVGKKREWFEVSGELQLDENRVLDLQLLFEQLRNNNNGGFIRLGAGEFVALTDEMRQRIQQLDGMLHERGKSRQLPVLAAAPFSELLEGFDDVAYDAAWHESLQRIESARHLRPAAPKNFHADLRPYQREGYDWLSRLAAWGVGACLADDMGLGKTVQALAVLTMRAELGPALVLAPASVVRNWRAECERFAPALTPIVLARRSDTHLLPQLGPGDLLLVSYGLLTYVADELTAIPYATVVLDEAQAIKNPTTQRARTVRELQADFRIATTGTPIENHLGELWSLFRFLNPGLLGSKKTFGEQYGAPIAAGDQGRRDQLRQLVQPFILRRRKDEVLRELPAKTEVVLTVTPTPEEAALYEALRREALAEIAEAPPEKKKFIVLRQLTKLRQAACHPRLVRPKSKLPGAKLQLVAETVRELLDNGHKALVFSQFVKHLKLVEDWVREAGIPYQYLDGSTPGKERERRVDAFQAGDGQLFLISLKAGGTGLNLTAADFVLHLDPWWNPAAEDQASDRAHRIGQQRPVTVYRFVSEGTIEEKVLALHADKRDLADQILAGTGKSAGLEIEEILRMLGPG